MGELIVLALIIWAAVKFFGKKKKAGEEAAAPTVVGFSEGQKEQLLVDAAEAYVTVAKDYYDVCRFELAPGGLNMSFQDYRDYGYLCVLLDNNDSMRYLKVLEALGDKKDSGWILRKFGYAEGSYWKVNIPCTVSKSTAESVAAVLKEFHHNKGDLRISETGIWMTKWTND